MTPTPAGAMQWIDVMRAGGPYAVIGGLLLFIVYLARVINKKDEKITVLNKLIYNISKERSNDQKKVSDYLLEEGKASSKAAAELAAALDKLSDKITEGKGPKNDQEVV